MAINTGSLSLALRPGLRQIFGMAYKDLPEQYSRIFDVKKSNMNFEKDVSYSPFNLAQVKDEGSAISYDISHQAASKMYEHVAYSLGYVITKEAIDDNLYPQLTADRTKALANSMRKTREVVCANVLNRAFTSGYVGADGKVLCAADHPLSRGGTQSNTQANAVDISELSLEQACVQIQKFKNGASIPINAMAKALIVPVSLMYEAKRILKNSDRPATADRDINAMVMNGDFPGGIVVNNFLTDENAYFIKTDVENGLTFFERHALMFDSDTDFDTCNMKFKAYDRYSAGWTDYMGVWGSPGA